MDDTGLVMLCAEGDEAAWETFVSRYSDCMYTAIKRTLYRFRRAPAREEIEDVYGDTLIMLLEDGCRRLKGFEGRNGSSLSTYLWVVASRCAVDKLRKDNISPKFNYDDFTVINTPDTRELPGDDCERRQRDAVVERVVGGLSTEDRLFVRLHYEEDLNTDEIADMLKVSPATVYSRKNRIKEKMQKIFRKEFSEKPS